MAVEPTKLLLVVAQEVSRILALPRLEVRLPEQEKKTYLLKPNFLNYSNIDLQGEGLSFHDKNTSLKLWGRGPKMFEVIDEQASFYPSNSAVSM